MIDTDILIVGGGIAGLTAAAAFGAAGFPVTCVDPAPPEGPAQGPDLRTTAVLQPARAFLEKAGLWADLAPHATALNVMRIVDAGGTHAPVTRDFVAADIGDMPFGWNLPNRVLRAVIADKLEKLHAVRFCPGIGFQSLLTRTDAAVVTLTTGNRLSARLVVAADGRGSAVRQAAGIGVTTRASGQKAIVFAVTHAAPHDGVSTEVHRSGGPFTLVPLPDFDGRPCSSVVWMDDGPAIARLAALPDDVFAAAATERSAGVMGPLSLVGERQVWPIISQVADRITFQRGALVAEAAHVLPPIGAQGLNLSLTDIATLLDLAVQRPDGLGDATMLAAFARARRADIRLRTLGIDALNMASRVGFAPLQDLRSAGLRALHGVAPVRKALMRLGLGAGP